MTFIDVAADDGTPLNLHGTYQGQLFEVIHSHLCLEHDDMGRGMHIYLQPVSSSRKWGPA